MGCPDWPTCFGQLVPPTAVDQLPADYKQVYSSYRHEKNVKFARYLTFAGLHETANQLLNDESVREEADFNATKTWVEYINRLIGVVIGLFIIALCWRSLSLRKSHPRIFYLSVLTLIAVVFQGWFGSIVVSTNLTTWTITIHMFIALFIVALLFYLLKLSNSNDMNPITGPASLKWILLGCMFLLLIQTFLGTEVRGVIDRLSSTVIPRGRWIEASGLPFVVHRSFSWLVLASHLLLLFKLKKTTGPKILPTTLIILILVTILTGTGMAYFGIPAYLQPIHLVFATLTFGLQLAMYFDLNKDTSLVLNKIV